MASLTLPGVGGVGGGGGVGVGGGVGGGGVGSYERSGSPAQIAPDFITSSPFLATMRPKLW